MRGLIHPITKALYEQDGTGNVRVTHRGRLGLFSPEGRWISGELPRVRPASVRLDRRASDRQQPPVERRRHTALIPGTPGNPVRAMTRSDRVMARTDLMAVIRG